MKQSTTVFFLICISLCAPFSGNAQDVNPISSSKIDFQNEAIRFEKMIFSFKGDEESLNMLFLNKAECYQQLGDYKNALATVNRANFYEGTDSTKFNLYYKAALYAYMNKEFKIAQGYLLEMQYYIAEETLVQKALFIDILVHYELEEWNQGIEKFKKYSKINNIDSLNVLELENKAFPKLKDPKKAENISVFLPGLGQWYAGYPLKGITSGVLQLGFAGWGAYSILTGYFFSGAFTGVSTFYLFYTGGIRHAAYLAEQTNFKRKENYTSPFIDLILKTEYNKKGGH